MSRPTSYHDNQRHDTGVYNGDNFALPLFNYPAPDASPAHSSGYRSASHQDLPQPSTQPPVPPPAARSPYHQSRQSVSHNQSLSSPYNPSSPLTPATSASQHYRQGSMSSALPHSAVPFPQANRSDLMLPPPASTSLGSLARSASLGRRKDPYAYSPDDVESGLGSMDMSSATPPWPGYGGRAPPHSPRDVIMSPNRPISNNNMNPPPLPTHNLTRPGAVTRDSGGSASPTRPPYASHAHRDSFSNNPYIPRGPDPGPSVPVITGTQQAQWTDHRRPVGQRVQSSSSFTQPSPSSDQLSPYLKPSLPGTSPHSPINNPYDLSPRYDNPPTLPASPHHNTAGWYEGDVAMPSSPLFDTRTLSAQQYPASQPATPAARPYDSGPPRGQPLRVRSGDVSRQSKQGFKQVRDLTDLQPQIKVPNVGRRADSDAPGKFISPLKCLTAQLPQTYALCSPQFRYETSDNPRRVLTKPSKPVHNDGADNEDWDYILYVNDVLGGEGGRDRYLILDVLGQGTFGQVVKCQNMRTHEIIAVKVVKNKPAYLNQSKMEVAILELLNREYDPNDTHHIIRMIESFTHKNHLCLVFECLSSNLYELIKQNQFKGLSTQLVKVFTQQLLESLAVLKDARLIHCDLKPENILLKTLQSPQIKVIDFGSACHEMQTVYTYIQSRFYRSPEVLLGLPYSTSIDMWSLGCIVVELFLGLPLFPGTSEYNQVSRIVDMLGNPPGHLLEVGKQTHEFFNYTGVDAYGKKQYVLKSMDQYATEHRTKEQPSKQYFKQTKLTEIIMEYPYSKKNQKQSDIDKEMANRRAFVDFVKGLLNLDPIQRWSPQQAAKHPFITGEKFTGPYQPATSTIKKAQTPTEPTPATTPTKKYGGLVQSPSSNRGQRVYSDAAAYNQQLAQHQSYTAQAQAQAQAASARPPPFSPGYDMRQAQSQSQQSPYSQRVPSQTHQSRPSAGQGQWQQQMPPPQPNFGQARVPSMSTSSSHASMRNNAPMVTAQTNPPPNSYYPQSRNRANTINQMDAIPPALARLTHFGAPDPSGTRNLTPVMNRDDAIREWERRQAGHSKTSSMAHTSYPQLEYLQEQAELATMSGQSWMFPTPYGHVMPSAGGHSRRPSGHAHSQSMSAHPAYSMQPPIGASPHHASSSAAPDYRRGQVSEYDPPLSAQPAQSSSSRAAYLPTYPPPAATSAPNSAFDAFDTRDQNLGMMYTPLQPNQASYNYAPPPHPGHHGHGQRASYSGPYHNGQGAALPGGNNPFAQNQPSSSPRYQRRSQQYGA